MFLASSRLSVFLHDRRRRRLNPLHGGFGGHTRPAKNHLRGAQYCTGCAATCCHVVGGEHVSDISPCPPVRVWSYSAARCTLEAMDFPEELANPDLVGALVKVSLLDKRNPQNPKLLADNLRAKKKMPRLKNDVVIAPRCPRGTICFS